MARRLNQGVTLEQLGEVVVDDQQLLADCIRLLRASGELGQLRLSDTVQLVAPVTPIRTVDVNLTNDFVSVRRDQAGPINWRNISYPPRHAAAQINSAGLTTNPAAGAVLADTGALAADDYYFLVIITDRLTAAPTDFRVQWRDAANAANQAEVPLVDGGTATFQLEGFATNERLRITAGQAMTGDVACSILHASDTD